MLVFMTSRVWVVLKGNEKVWLNGTGGPPSARTQTVALDAGTLVSASRLQVAEQAAWTLVRSNGERRIETIKVRTSSCFFVFNRVPQQSQVRRLFTKLRTS